MPVIRVHKTRDYTVMSNAHFREKEMTLKAKGLHSLMLSLPEDWDYSIAGLTTLSKDGKDSVMSALNELERFGYLKRTRVTDEKGKFAGYDYDIFEQPQTENPYAENPNTDKPNTENPPQYITNQSITKKSNTNVIEIKKERKGKAAANSFDLLIENYLETINPFEVDEVRGLLQEWLKVRKAKRAAMTDKAIELNLQKLNEVAATSNMSVAEYLKEVIMRGWQTFYEIKDYSQGKKTGGGKRGVTDEMKELYDYYQQEANNNAN